MAGYKDAWRLGKSERVSASPSEIRLYFFLDRPVFMTFRAHSDSQKSADLHSRQQGGLFERVWVSATLASIPRLQQPFTVFCDPCFHFSIPNWRSLGPLKLVYSILR